MMRLLRLALLVLSALPLCARTAGAQTIPSVYDYVETTQYVGPFAGYLWTDRNLNVNDSTEVPFGPKSAPIFGVRYGARFTGPLSGEVALGFVPSERELFRAQPNADTTRVTPVAIDATASAPLAVLDAILRLNLTGARTWRGFAPYVLGMGGLVTEVGGTSGEESELAEAERFDFGPSFAVGTGAGTEWFPSERISVRAEVQGRLWRMTAPTGFVISAVRESEWNPVVGATLGAAIHF